MTFFPWVIKPLYAHLLRNPTNKHLKLVWSLLSISSAVWLYLQMRDPFDPDENFTDDEREIYENQYKNSLYHRCLLFGMIIQFLTVIMDVIVDYIQVCTIRHRPTLAWVKTIEVGLYKIGSMVGGSIFLIFSSSITYSILLLASLYFIVGALALFVFKLPETPGDSHDSLREDSSPAPTPPNYAQENENSNLINNKQTSALSSNTKNEPTRSKIPAYIRALYQTKCFVCYLLSYKICQGFLQKIFPQWMTQKADYSMDTANIICGLFTGLTSFTGTVVGGYVTTFVKEQHMKLKKKDQSRWRSVKSDLWFWCCCLILVCSMFICIVVKKVDYEIDNQLGNMTSINSDLICIGTNDDSNSFENNSTTNTIDTCQIQTDLALKSSYLKKANQTSSFLKFEFLSDGLGTFYNLIFIFMFVLLTFIGGIITTLTFTEMTIKSQEVIEIKYANEYLSWISMTEITGKYVFSVFSGKIVEILCMDYYRAYVFATLFQVVTILSYVGSTFEGRIVGNSVRAVSSHAP